MDTRALKIFLIPPVKTVLMFNDKNRCFYEQPTELLNQKVYHHNHLMQKSGRKLIVLEKEKTKMAGLNATRFVCGYKDRSGIFDPMGEFWTTNEIKLPSELMRVTCLLTDVPAGYGLPLKMVRLDDKARKTGVAASREYVRDGKTIQFRKVKVTLLETVTAKELPSVGSRLKMPSAYEPVSNEVLLLTKKPGTPSESDISDLFGEPNGGNGPKRGSVR